VIAGVAHEDPRIAELHLGVIDVALLADVAEHLLEAESPREKVERPFAVRAEDVWDHPRHRLLLSPEAINLLREPHATPRT
jgi:hypothetical protein